MSAPVTIDSGRTNLKEPFTLCIITS
jgi:hypothetical protein